MFDDSQSTAGFEPAFIKRFQTESWPLYGIGMMVLLTRCFSRIYLAGGLRKLKIDDWIAVQLIAWYTMLIVSLNMNVTGGGSNYMIPEEVAALTPESIAERISGSKWIFVSEQAELNAVWSCKAIMCFVYTRITFNLWQERWIMAVNAWVAIGFVACQLALFLSCRPFQDYFAVPTDNHECWTYSVFGTISAVFNLSSDLAALSIALPLVYSLKRPWQQKAPLIFVFALGLFVVGAALTNKLVTWLPWIYETGPEYMFWYVREATVAVIVCSLPALWAGVREMYPQTRQWGYRASIPPPTWSPHEAQGEALTSSRPTDIESGIQSTTVVLTGLKASGLKGVGIQVTCAETPELSSKSLQSPRREDSYRPV